MNAQPATIEELQRAVRESAAVRVRGGGSKSAPHATDTMLDLRRLTGITEYSPEECVFTALAGTSVRDVEAALARHGQYLPFDPPFAADGATLGGTVASGVSGPRRYRYGGVRDFLLGVCIVDGEGRVIRSGGKVVKNAAGFLLHYAMVGSLGRFGVLTELTFKVFPAPAARRSATIDCGSVAEAFATARKIEAIRSDCEAIDFDERGVLTVTVAGSAAAIDARLDRVVRGTGREPDAEVQDARTGGPSAAAVQHAGTRGGSCVKVAGVMDVWPRLQPLVTRARFMCAGAVAWLETADLPALTRALTEAGLEGLVIRGAHAGRRVGAIPDTAFERRVRAVLDPQDKFSAAPDSRR